MSDKAPYFFDAGELTARAKRHADAYRSAVPYAHAVLDDFLPLEVAQACAAEFPGPDDIAWDLYTDDGRTLKLTQNDEAVMPPLARQLVGQFNSGAMITFLEELTGIQGLVADPHLAGGGMHRIEPGGFLDVHADFNRHYLLNLDRRINVLYYLNPDWDEAWEGHLELWDRSMSACVHRIAPILNRCVIFNTTDTSFHGHPSKLACPPGQSRRSLAFYYYTNGRPEAERSAPHSTLYQAPAASQPQLRARARAAVARRLPDGAKSSIRSVLRRLDGTQDTGPVAAAGPENHWARVSRLFGELQQSGRASRPNYAWSLLHVADIARTLGLPRVSAIEFGVAGGNGLVALEDAADFVEERTGVVIDVVGFDHGVGIPAPKGPPDAPYLIQAGQFPMDEPKLRARLHRARLHIGLVSETLDAFVTARPAPIGFISFDLDYYSSTKDAFRLFDQAADLFLPRVLCYFDDVLGYPWGDSNGPRLAVSEFNATRDRRHLDHLPGFRYNVPSSELHARWVECMYLAHIYDHPRYEEDEGVALVTRLDLF
jgi:hypothetical protein